MRNEFANLFLTNSKYHHFLIGIFEKKYSLFHQLARPLIGLIDFVFCELIVLNNNNESHDSILDVIRYSVLFNWFFATNFLQCFFTAVIIKLKLLIAVRSITGIPHNLTGLRYIAQLFC